MNIKEIQQAIIGLSPDELARLRAWFKEYESNIASGESSDSQLPIKEILKKSRGSLKGKGVLKALLEERRRESLS